MSRLHMHNHNPIVVLIGDYRIRVLVNEVPVEVPHPLCSDSIGGCPINKLPVILNNITGGSFSLPCQLEDFCS